MKAVVRRVALPLAATFALVAGAVTSARAETVYNGVTPVSGTILNICNDDSVTLSGMAHLVLGVTASANGGYFLRLEENFADVTGTYRGNTYRVLIDFVLSAQMNAGTTTTSVGQVSLVSTGSAQTLEGRLLTHITLDANGVPTATITMGSISCGG